MIDGAGGGKRLGACLDSCHLLASGYDIRTPEGLSDVLGNRGLGTTERLLLVSTFNSTISFGEQRRGTVQQDLLEAKQALSLAENVEKPSIVEHAAARKTTARSVGRSVVVGGLIGLILGILAAILWEPGYRRFAARPT